MKTFKLISLDVLEELENDVKKHPIKLLDGLIIDREDDKNQWVIEAYLEQEYSVFFRRLKEKDESVILLAKITKKTNQPATFLASIIDLNEINNNINVLFFGTMVDRTKGRVAGLLKKLIDEGYEGEELLDEFRDRV